MWNTAIEKTYCIRRGVTLALITASKDTDRVRDVVLFSRLLPEIHRW